ncbi:MAG: endonuclease, partial [Pseudomonas sp.]|nr:endonuclease [Pseudomonas sp.]
RSERQDDVEHLGAVAGLLDVGQLTAPTIGNAQFGDLDDSVPSKFDDIGCDMKTSFQLVEPRDDAKGNVARAIFYMHVEYGLPIVGQVQVFKQWHQMDPPDADEIARNDKIANLQGTRNRFIDNPELVEQQINN